MASNKKAAQDAGTGTEATGESKPKRSRKPAEDQLGWTGEMQAVLILAVLQNPGRLTTVQLADHLKAHPAFAGIGHLVTAEKVRQQLKKLSKANVARGREALEPRKRSTSGSDIVGVLDAVYAQLAQAQGQGSTAAPSAPTIPTVAAPTPVLGGGLIPTPS